MKKKDPHFDKLQNQKHYLQGNIEVIDYLKAKMPELMYLGGLFFNVEKYCSRAVYKLTQIYTNKKSPYTKANVIEDLKKAYIYMGWILDTIEGRPLNKNRSI